MNHDNEATWQAILSGADVSMEVAAVITATRGIRGDVVLPVEQVFDKASDGSVLIVRKFRRERGPVRPRRVHPRRHPHNNGGSARV
jgi:hypothetical protein